MKWLASKLSLDLFLSLFSESLCNMNQTFLFSHSFIFFSPATLPLSNSNAVYRSIAQERRKIFYVGNSRALKVKFICSFHHGEIFFTHEYCIKNFVVIVTGAATAATATAATSIKCLFFYFLRRLDVGPSFRLALQVLPSTVYTFFFLLFLLRNKGSEKLGLPETDLQYVLLTTWYNASSCHSSRP